MNDTPAAPDIAPRDDEFYGGIWWKRDGAEWRDATPRECAAEIRKLRAVHESDQACVKAALVEVDRLRAGIQAMLYGNYPHPRAYRPGDCPHGTPYYQECAQCDTAWLQGLLK